MIKISRLILWIGGLSLFFLGTKIAQVDFSYLLVFYYVLLSFPVNVIVYGLNDIYDYESDKLNPRKNTAQGLILEKTYHKLVLKYVWIFSLLFISISYLVNLYVFLFSILFVLLCYVYSVPPIRLKTKAPIDSMVNGIGYTLFFILGLYFNGFNGLYLELILTLVFLFFGGHIFFTVLDYESDKIVGDKTFAVKYGKNFALFISFKTFTLVYILTSFQTQILNYFLLLIIFFSFLAFFVDLEKYKKYAIYGAIFMTIILFIYFIIYFI
ncbi:MAG: UbiA family prenyltransferase [Nanoarchaeales archaeon]|nr:UbiA family prenyltransferase [Nanoarchaeales archaeon]